MACMSSCLPIEAIQQTKILFHSLGALRARSAPTSANPAAPRTASRLSTAQIKAKVQQRRVFWQRKDHLIMYQSQLRQNRVVISTVVRSTKWKNLDMID